MTNIPHIILCSGFDIRVIYLTLKWTSKFSSESNMCDGGYQNDISADVNPKRSMYTGKIPGGGKKV